MIANVFINAFQFIPEHASLLFHKGVATVELAFAALGMLSAWRFPLGSGSAISTAASSSRSRCRTSGVPCRASS